MKKGNSMIQSEFRDAGYRVFGLYGADSSGKCKCGNQHCSAVYKHPLTGSWQHTPDWSDDQFEVGHQIGQFDTGYGVLCKGLLVVDVDARNGGVESFQKLMKKVPMQDCGLIVETGSGGGSKHLYFDIDNDLALLQHHKDYPGIDFKSSGYVVGPGSMHKSGNKYVSVVGAPGEINAAPEALLALLHKPEYHRGEYNGASVDVSDNDLSHMLTYIPNDLHYEDYIKIGMAIHHVTGGSGMEIWHVWASKSDKYTGNGINQRWKSFGNSATPVTYGSLVHYAEKGGWVRPVTFESTDTFDYVPEPSLDLAGIDLLRPPGFVGEVAAWIESTSRRPREVLSVAAALISIGNIIGPKYIDKKDRVTSNLFIFCTAGSGTGKESMQQACFQLMDVVGLLGPCYGSFKSEQEIIKNLALYHDVSFNIYDEVGHLLSKVKSAQKSGNAVYLEGVFGTLMSIYGKSNGVLPLTGDLKREVQKTLLDKIKLENKRIEENDGGSHEKIKDLKRRLKSSEKGVVSPFLSMLGLAAPDSFDNLIDRQSATNGFIRRSLIFYEKNNAPKSKKNFRKPLMSLSISNTIRRLYDAGSFDVEGADTINVSDKRIEIPSSKEAESLLDQVSEWFDEEAARQVELTGLEALYMGAYELVSKISFILGAPSGLRTSEHVLWSYALIRKDIEDKSMLVIANDQEQHCEGNALAARIVRLLGDEGMKTGAINNKIRKVNPEVIKLCLLDLEIKKIINATEIIPKKGRKTTLWAVN